jgi:hypothetical protein
MRFYDVLPTLALTALLAAASPSSCGCSEPFATAAATGGVQSDGHIQDPCADSSECAGSGGAGANGGSESGGSGGVSAGASGGGTGGTAGDAPVVVLLIDRSSSMSGAYLDPAVSRWTSLRDAILSDQGPIKRNESWAAFGLYTFTTLEPEFDPTCPLVRGVAAKLDNFAAIQAFYASESLPIKSETPTGMAVAEVTQMLAGVTGPKHLLLITDGEPDTCELRDPQCGHDPTFFALQQAFSAGVNAHVFGIGDGEGSGGWLKFLQDAANAGGGQPVEEPTLAHRQGCESLIGGFKAAYSPIGGTAGYYLSPQQSFATALDLALGSIAN